MCAPDWPRCFFSSDLAPDMARCLGFMHLVCLVCLLLPVDPHSSRISPASY